MRGGTAAILAVVMVLTGCGTAGPPPREMLYEGLPIQGSIATAKRLGFDTCVRVGRGLRCRSGAVRLKGQGPYRAAVDLLELDGSGGFYQLTLWHDRDQHAVSAVGDALEKDGWQLCRTGQEDRGDQEIYTKPGSRVRISIDLSYWGKRRIRVLPELGQPTGYCWPNSVRERDTAGEHARRVPAFIRRPGLI